MQKLLEKADPDQIWISTDSLKSLLVVLNQLFTASSWIYSTNILEQNDWTWKIIQFRIPWMNDQGWKQS